MARYIDADIFIHNICRMGVKALGEFKICDVKRVADETPTADVKEVVRGEWVIDIRSYYDDYNDCHIYATARCSNCDGIYSDGKTIDFTVIEADGEGMPITNPNVIQFEKDKFLNKIKENHKFYAFCPHCGSDNRGEI